VKIVLNETASLTESPPIGCREEWVPVDGLKIRCWRAGAGPALVLLHGLLGYSFSWRHAIPILAAEFEVLAPDLPGAGFSELSSHLDCRLSAAAKRLRRLLDASGIDSCDLVGSSYGGATAAMFAATAPSRVRHLVLVSPANPWSRIGRKRLALLRYRVIASLFPLIARGMRFLNPYFVRRMYGDPRRISSETLRGYARPLARPGIFEHAVKIARTWHAGMQEFQAALPAIRSTPTLLIWGSEDRVVDLASAAMLEQNLPNSQVRVMDGVGHLPYEESPEEFCSIVHEFLASTATAMHDREVT
jgi:pimeloyl-ACP methyl ester carboxylesterase